MPTEGLYCKKATIQILTTFTLAPFFKSALEVDFYKVRNSKPWNDLLNVNKNGNGDLHSNRSKCGPRSKLFRFDRPERQMEELAYSTEMFRGIVFNDFFTAYYRRSNHKKAWDEAWALYHNSIKDIIIKLDNNASVKGYKHRVVSVDLAHVRVNFLNSVLNRVKDIFQKWDIYIRLTRSGLATVTFRYKLPEDNNTIVSHRDCVEKVENIMKDPYAEYINQNPDEKSAVLLSKIQNRIFTSYLYAASVWAIHLFLRDRMLYKNVAKIIGRRSAGTLEHPWEVRYTSLKSLTNETAPLRNYNVAYLFSDLEGTLAGSSVRYFCDGSTGDKGDENPEQNESGKKGFIKRFSSSFLELTLDVHGGGIDALDKFTNKEIEALQSMELSKLEASGCLLGSEAIVMWYPSDSKINIGQHIVSYEEYWKNILRGFYLLIGCKTMLQILGRLLIECRTPFGYKGKLVDVRIVQEKLKIISLILMRTRKATTVPQITRPSYIGEKLEAFRHVLGLPELLNNVAADYEEIGRSVNIEIESTKTDAIQILTLLLVPLTIVIAAEAGNALIEEVIQKTYDAGFIYSTYLWLTQTFLYGVVTKRVDLHDLTVLMKFMAIFGWTSFVVFFMILIPMHIRIFPSLWKSASWRDFCRAIIIKIRNIFGSHEG